ncbi:putative RNA methyltransferase [Nocardiopsis salina]|uniref:putative RNA methyltransferase n=1 Tax=Nocardiopsis salina TaxID=245836 RepID=UPI0003472ADC|nr:hypothetical protein [Nocardiopsis salina]
MLEALACPVCRAGLTLGVRALSCPGGHTFDLAREGYASVLTGATPPGSGDTKEMVADRLRFQQHGHYDPIGHALARALDVPGLSEQPLVLDAGGGTGHYLALVLEALPHAHGLTTDVSKFAARKAAKVHPRAGAATADTWRGLPLRTGTADALINVFAPRESGEFHRVLRPDGLLVVVTPDTDHLGELRGPLGLLEVDPRKDERLSRGLHGHFTPQMSAPLRFTLQLDHADAATVVGMGPSARHMRAAELTDRVAALPDPVTVTASVRVNTYRPRPAEH